MPLKPRSCGGREAGLMSHKLLVCESDPCYYFAAPRTAAGLTACDRRATHPPPNHPLPLLDAGADTEPFPAGRQRVFPFGRGNSICLLSAGVCTRPNVSVRRGRVCLRRFYFIYQTP